MFAEIADRVKNFAVLYVCDLDQVPDFKQMYEVRILSLYPKTHEFLCADFCLAV